LLNTRPRRRYGPDDVGKFVEVPKEGVVLEQSFSATPTRKDALLNQHRKLVKVSLELLTDHGAQSIELIVRGP